MSKSTRLLTATYILSYVASSSPEVVTTERIAQQVDEHPTRVRQIVSALVKHGLLEALRGASGGVLLKRPANEITLRDVYEAVHDTSIVALHLFEPTSEWAGKSSVHKVFENLRGEMEHRVATYLAEHTLDQMFAPIIVPFSPGGTTDILAHALADHLGTRLGGPPVIEHLPELHRKQRAAAAAPGPLQHSTMATLSGHRVSIMTNSCVLSKSLGSKTTAIGFMPISLLAESEMILAVSTKSKWKTVGDLVKSAQAKRGRLKFASVGHASVSHLSAELFQKAANVQLVHVAFDGAQPAVQALIKGDVDLYFGTPPTFLPHIRLDKVRPLATTALHKGDVLPDLPRMADIYPGFEVVGWQGVFAPLGTPAAVVRKLHRSIVDVMDIPDVRKRLIRQGFRVATSTPEALAKRIHAEVARWRELVAAADIDITA